jgi:hypothetical protein
VVLKEGYTIPVYLQGETFNINKKDNDLKLNLSDESSMLRQKKGLGLRKTLKLKASVLTQNYSNKEILSSRCHLLSTRNL